MRTVHVDTGREMRGGQWQALYLVEHLEHATLLAPAGTPLLAEACARGIDAQVLSLRSLARWARKADLVHAHDARAHTLAAFAGGAPLVVSRRVGFPVRESTASRWKYSRATRYLAVSRFVAARLADAGVPAQKIRVVYDGVPVPSPAKPEPGRIVALASKAPPDTGIPIHLTRNLWQDLSTASIFVYLSEMEGMGSAALAAMSAGVPVIASRVGGLPEVVEHECTGLLVDTPDELRAALRRLLDDPAAAAEMGRRGRERVEQKFLVQTMIDGTLRVYGEVRGC
ncbi:MAG: hypothetical protein DMG59_03590 [Acidobacteria bacterium]|nr:MAG: hypothetical protein DMG59_03590 [Acidobacteriota bacterium]